MRYVIVLQKINQLPHIVTEAEVQEAMATAATVELDTIEKVLTVAKALLSVRKTANPQLHFLIDFEQRNLRRFYFDPQGVLTLADPDESGNQLGYATDWRYFEPDAVAPMPVVEAAATSTLPPKRTKADRVKERKERVEKKKR